MSTKSSLSLFWYLKSTLLLVIVFTSLSSARLFANEGCNYTNSINKDGFQTGKRGNESDEYNVSLTLLYKGNLITIPIKMCLFRKGTKCYPDVTPKREELEPLEKHLKSQYNETDYDFDLDKKLKHPGYLSGREAMNLLNKYHNFVLELRSLSCYSGVCAEETLGQTLTGSEARCIGNGSALGVPITVPYGEFQRKVEEYAKNLADADERMEKAKDICNVGKRDKKYFDLGRALVQIGTAVHTIEICLFHPKVQCFPQTDSEKKKFLEFIEKRVKEQHDTPNELPGAGAQHVKDLASWSCLSGKCNSETKECEIGVRLSQILQFKDAQQAVSGAASLRSLVPLIGIATLFLTFWTSIV